jgi:hypothetical protein
MNEYLNEIDYLYRIMGLLVLGLGVIAGLAMVTELYSEYLEDTMEDLWD